MMRERFAIAFAISVGAVACNTNRTNGGPASASSDDGSAATSSAPPASSRPPAPSAPSVWMGVTWVMSYADVVRALEHEGLAVERSRANGSFGELRAKGPAYSVEMSFIEDRPVNIVVTHESLSKDAAAAISARLKERWGASQWTSVRIEWRWERRDSSTTILAVSGGDLVNEDYLRGDATGDVGFAGLSWQMSPASARQALARAGYDARIETHADSGPRATPSVSFKKGDREGEVSFGEGGMLEVATWGPLTGGDDARAKELEKALGAPKKHETRTVVTWVAEAAKIEQTSLEDRLGGRVTVVETYRPKK